VLVTNARLLNACRYYWGLVGSQFFHIWLCKTRTVSVFKHPIFANRKTLYGAIVALLIAAFIINVPGVHNLFDGYYMPVEVSLQPRGQ